MWPKTDLAELGKESFDEIEPGAVRGREGEVKTTKPLGCEPRLGFLGDMCGMIVENQLDGGIRRVGTIEKLEEFDELSAAMTIPDQRMNLASEQIDASQQARLYS